MFVRIVRACARRPGRVLALVAVLVAVACALALRLEPSAATETLARSGDRTVQATERFRERFGDHSVVVLVRGELSKLLLTSDLGRLIRLEGCLSGNRPPGGAVAGGRESPCDRLAALRAVQVVYGPGTFANASAGEIADQVQSRMRGKSAQAERAARAARRVARAQGKSRAEQEKLADSAQQLVYAEFLRDLLQLNLRYGLGLTGLPTVNDPNFISALYFDPERGATTPKARFSYLLPSSESAAIQVRLKPDLSADERAEAVALIRSAVRMDAFALSGGATYTVTGAPVVAEDLADALAGSTLRLIAVGLALMALVLALVFRGRLRLAPLGVALAAVAIVFGGLALLGAPLTMASIAVLPVLLGLGVDYAIQYQARVEEEASLERAARGDSAAATDRALERAARNASAAGTVPALKRAAQSGASTDRALERAARVGVPAIATAALATGVGFLVLLLSPVPMVQGFGALLVAGIAVAFVLALTAGTAALALAGRSRGRDGFVARSVRGAGEIVDGAARGFGRVLGRPAARAAGAVVAVALRRPGRVLAVGLAVAAVGWAVDSRSEVVSDLERLVPQDLQAVADLRALQEATGVAGEVDVLVEGEDLTDPAVVRWMRDYQAGVLEKYGPEPGGGCERAELCPGLSLPELFRSDRAASDRERIRGLLDAVPPYFSRAVITPDRRTANLAFGIRLASLERQGEIIEDMRDRLDPPEGVTAELAGLPVIAAEANATLSDPLRRLATIAIGLLAVLVVLLAVARLGRPTPRAAAPPPNALAGGSPPDAHRDGFPPDAPGGGSPSDARGAGSPLDAFGGGSAPGRGRRRTWREAWRRAWVPLVPIALATGWSALVLWALGVPLNPLSAMLGALVLAISTEFAVLLAYRFEAERAAGHPAAEALRRTYRSTGAAVLASGATAIAGFAVLALSDVRMLRDFGLVTVVDLTVSLLGVLAVLPAVLVLAERRAAERPATRPAAAPAVPA